MVDDRRARIRRNMARAWAFAAAAHAQSIQNISWDLYGNPVGLAGGLMSATLSTPPSTGPTLVSIGTRLDIAGPGGNLRSTASISVGTASANRRVFVVGFVPDGGLNPAVGVVIGGTAATIHFAGDLSINDVSMFIAHADVPTGTVVSLSVSFSAGVTGGMKAYAFVADKSEFINPSPTVRTASGLSFNGSPVTASVTTSANACVLAIMSNNPLSNTGTLSPSANFAYTKFNDPDAWVSFLYANSVGAQTSTIPYHAGTGSWTAAVAVIAWR